jgi:hypothetical protein
MFDLEYHRIDAESPFAQLASGDGVGQRVIPEAECEHGCEPTPYVPELGTRATVRAQKISELAGHGREGYYQCNWHYVFDQKNERLFRMDRVEGGGEAWEDLPRRHEPQETEARMSHLRRLIFGEAPPRST